jgi:hypothetical protein
MGGLFPTFLFLMIAAAAIGVALGVLIQGT